MAQMVKSLSAMQEMLVRSLGGEDPLKKGMATHSSVFGETSPVTSQVKNPPACRTHRVWKILWRGKWQHTPVFLPGEFHGQRPQSVGLHRFGHETKSHLNETKQALKSSTQKSFTM